MNTDPSMNTESGRADAPDAVPFAVPCRRCCGGTVPLMACPQCADAASAASYSGESDPGFLYRPYDLMVTKPGPRAPRPAQFPAGGACIVFFPKCGHRVPDIADLPHRGRYLPPVLFETTCRFCKGTGQVTRLLPAQEAARREQRRAEEKRLLSKRCQTQAALLALTLHGPRSAKPLCPPCGAKCRDGHACLRKCLPGLMRCQRHKGRAYVPLAVQHWRDRQRRQKPEPAQNEGALSKQ